MKRYATSIGSRSGLHALGTASVANALQGNAHDRTLTLRYDALGRKTAIIQSSVSSNYDPVAGARYSAAPETRYAYNAYGEMASESVRLDNTHWATTHHYYDALGRKSVDVDPLGYVTAWTYTATGELARKTAYARAVDVSGLSPAQPPALPEAGDAATGYDRITSYTYDKLGRELTQAESRHYQDHAGHTLIGALVTEKTYDAIGNVIRIRRGGAVSTTTYDALGNVIETTAPARAILADTTPGAGLGERITVAPETDYQVNAFGEAVAVTAKSGTAIPHDRTTYNHYDPLGRLAVQIDPAGHASRRTYDAAGHLIKEQHTEIDAAKRVWTIATVNAYDSAGHLTATTLTRTRGGKTVTEAETHLSYNAFGELTGRGSGAQATPEEYFHYDQAGRLIETNSGDGVLKRYEYNLAGVKTRQSVGSPDTYVTTIYHLDADGRATEIELPPQIRNHAKPHIERGYDRFGNVISATDARGFTTRFGYNEAGQVTHTIEPIALSVDEHGQGHWLHPETRTFYDLAGHQIGAEDANGHISRRYYDAAGELILSEDALGDARSYAYDAFSEEVESENARGYVTTKTYDAAGHVVATGDIHIENNAWVAATLERYTVNAAGDRLTVTDALDRTQTYTYDARHHVIASTSAAGVKHHYAYDERGHRITAGDESYEQTWTYDYFGHVLTHTDRGGHHYTYTYRDGRLATETSDAGISNRNGLDQGAIVLGDGEDEQDVTSNSATTLRATDGDGDGNPPPPPPPPIRIRTYTWYANGLLKEISESGTDNRYRYDYDAAGNRILEDSLTYDGHGNPIHTRTQIVYDSHNRVARVLSRDLFHHRNTLDVRYAYDAAGNRRHVRVQSGYGRNATPIDATPAAPAAIAPDTTEYLRAGRAFHFEIPAAELFADPQGGALQYDAVHTPSWLHVTYDATDNVFAVNGKAPAAGERLPVAITARNPAGSTTSTVTFIVSAAGTDAAGAAPSVAHTIPNLIVRPGEALNAAFAASDYFETPYHGDPLTLSATLADRPAWLRLSTDGGTLRLTGTPAADAADDHWTVTVTATDAAGRSVKSTFTLYLQSADAPTVTHTIADQTADAGEFYHLEMRVEALFTDTGDPSDVHDADLRLSAHLASGAPLPAWLEFSLYPNQGKPWLHLRGTPPADAKSADYAIVLAATTTTGKTASTTFTLHLHAHKPPALVKSVPQQTWPLNIDNHLTLTAANYFKSDAGPLRYTLAGSPPGWVTFSASGGKLTLTGKPTQSAQIGDYTLKIRATDTFGASSILKVPVHVKYDAAPVMHNGGLPDTLNATEGQAFSYTIPAGTFTDPDGNPLTYRFQFYKLIPVGGLPAYRIEDLLTYNYPNGTYDEADGVIVDPETPTWLKFHPATRTLSGTPPNGFDWRLVLTVSDGLKSVSDTTTLKVAGSGDAGSTGGTDTPDQAPVYQGSLPASFTLVPGESFRYTVPADAFSDPDGDALTYSIAVKRFLFDGKDYDTSPGTDSLTTDLAPAGGPDPAWFSFDAASRTFSIDAPTSGTGLISVNLIATDPDGKSAVAALGFAIQPTTSAVDTVSIASPTSDAGATGEASATPQMWAGDDPFPPISPAANVQDYWYTYDAANRELVVNGKLTNQGDADASHHIVLDGARDTSYEQHYDAAGDIISRRYNVNGTNYTDRSAYTRQGQLAATWYTNPNNVDDDDADSLAETRHYDAAGQLIEIDRYADPAARAAGADGEPVDIGGRLISETTFNYTADGKLRYQDHFGVTDSWSAYSQHRRIDPYDFYQSAPGEELAPQTTPVPIGGGGDGDGGGDGGGSTGGTTGGWTPPAPLTHLSRIAYTGQNADGMLLGYDPDTGDLLGYRYTQYAKAAADDSTLPDKFSQTFTYSYRRGDTDQAATIDGASNTADFQAASTLNIYDPFGREIGRLEGNLIDRADAPDLTVTSYAYGAEGAILETRHGYLDPYGDYRHQSSDGQTAPAPDHYYNAAGLHLGHLTEAGSIDFNAATGGVAANQRAGQGTQHYTVQQGDTLRNLAERLYGNAQLWYVIADANGLSGDEALTAGTSLTLPARVADRNTAGTYQPYDASQILGAATPALPYMPQSDQGCNALATIVVIAIAIVVTYYTAGAASGAFASALGETTVGADAAFAGGFVGGIAGSVASQEAGVELGVQDHFSLRQALAAGLTTGVAYGVSGAGSATSSTTSSTGSAATSTVANAETAAATESAFADGVARGAFNYAVAYAAQDLTGQHPSFSWRALAAEAIGAGVGAETGQAVNQGLNNVNPYTKAFIDAYATAGATGVVSSLINHGGRVDYERIAVDAFGNALGNSLAEIGRQDQLKAQAQQEQQKLEAEAKAMNAQIAKLSAAKTREQLDQIGARTTAAINTGAKPAEQKIATRTKTKGETEDARIAQQADEQAQSMYNTVVASNDRMEELDQAAGQLADLQQEVNEAFSNGIVRGEARTADGLPPEQDLLANYPGASPESELPSETAASANPDLTLPPVNYEVYGPGPFERAHDIAVAGFNDPHNGWFTKSVFFTLGVVEDLPALTEEGVRSALNRFSAAGQEAARVSLAPDTETKVVSSLAAVRDVAFGGVMAGSNALPAEDILATEGSVLSRNVTDVAQDVPKLARDASQAVRNYGKQLGDFYSTRLSKGTLFGETPSLAQQVGGISFNFSEEATSIGSTLEVPDSVPAGVTYEGPLYRAVPAGGDPLDISYSFSANGRYTAFGQGGLYFSSNAGTVEAEFVNNGSSLIGRDLNVFPDSSVSNLLNLTDPAVREELGVSLEDITRVSGTPTWRYEVTQPLGELAQLNGYNGILAPSAQADGGVNLILFDSNGVK